MVSLVHRAIELEEVQLSTVYTLIDNEGAPAAITKKDILGWHLRANAIGDYYDIQPLCTLSCSKLRIEVNRNWSPPDFIHLLTEACTTRKTGDLKFHRLFGEKMGNHLEDLPGIMLRSIVASSLGRMESMQQHITQQDSIIHSLEQIKSAVEAGRTMARHSNVQRGPFR
ncbi:hypothetical protein KVR01_013537 [Diaporthe batatas]|uniref:uncharacterized protein n=1 Tax=Diaporthe batatas TaxID=748121 RepID=UPI001D03A380|nr:uncharacterized protein KVR01_013537 [Diaporthe batatas]KAG8156586.1 hypothetical protein KVR01_013537 [Diaporthe batatas]